MTEHQRLQKMRDLGFRLQELQLIRVEVGASYAGAALSYLFNLYQVQKPAGMPLEQTLSILARVVQNHHQLPYRRLTADASIGFFQSTFCRDAKRAHPSYLSFVRFDQSPYGPNCLRKSALCSIFPVDVFFLHR